MLESLEEAVSCLCGVLVTGECLAPDVEDILLSAAEESLDLYELAVMRIILGDGPPVTVTILSLLILVQLVVSSCVCLFTCDHIKSIQGCVYIYGVETSLAWLYRPFSLSACELRAHVCSNCNYHLRTYARREKGLATLD